MKRSGALRSTLTHGVADANGGHDPDIQSCANSTVGGSNPPPATMNATAEMQWRSPEFLVVIAHNSATFTDVVPAVTGT
jgi:hypothetical protein